MNPFTRDNRMKPLSWWEQNQEDLREAQGLNRPLLDAHEPKSEFWIDLFFVVLALASIIYAWIAQ